MRERHSRLRYLRLNIILLTLLYVSSAFGQQELTVVDIDNKPIADVTVQNITKGLFEISNDQGQVVFSESFSRDDIIELSHLSFDKLVMTGEQLFGSNNIIKLSKANTQIEEVILVGRNQKVKSGTLLPLERINAEEITKLQVQTTADLLEKSANVYIQRSQLGGGSPIIRGFEANKVLLVIDGVRMNNAIYRSGHLQNAITVDEQILSSVDVLFGPGSILYGSDAIGGVVHFRSLEPALTEGIEQKAKVFTRYATASQEKTIHGNYVFSNKNYSGFFSVTHSDFGDLITGSNRPEDYPFFGARPDYVLGSNNPESVSLGDSILINDNINKQIGSAYSQTDLSGKLRLQINNHAKLLLNTQFSTSSNVPRYDQLIERSGTGLKFAEWYYGPQTRLLFSPSFSYDKANAVFDELNIIAAYQFLEEDRFNRQFDSDQKNENKEDLSVLSLSLDLKKKLGQVDLDYGLEVQQNELQSISSNNTFTRYPNGSNSMFLYGLYSKLSVPVFEALKLETGGRFSGSKISVNYEQDDFFDWPEYFYSGIENKTNNISFLSGVSLDLGSFQLNLLGGTAFRAPNIDDLAKIRVNSNEIVIPNPDLKPEKTKNIEVQVKFGSKDNYISGTAYLIKLTDAIVRENFNLPDGSDVFISEGESLNIAANVNANSASVKGVNLNVAYKPIDQLSLLGSLSITEGVINNVDGSESPLGHIPPVFGKIKANYTMSKTTQQIGLNFNLKKPIENFGGSVDNPELATPEGSLGWYTINYYSSYQLSSRINFDLAFENILDLHYRPFSSGISAPGRNIIFTVRAKFF